MIINPPFQASDETAHFWKTYAISKGSLNYKKLTTDRINGFKMDKPYTISGDYLAIGISKAPYINSRIRFKNYEKTSFAETKQILNIKLQKQKEIFQHYTVPAYTPLSYFPQFILMKVLTALNLNPGWILYILRFCSLLVYLSLTYLAIKTTPIKKWLFLTIGILPMAVYQASNLNTDSITNGLCFLTIAYILKLSFDEKIQEISKLQFLIMGLLITMIGICKFAYLPIVLIYFFIPKSKITSELKRYGAFLLYLFINISIIFTITHYNITNSSNLFGEEIKSQASQFIIQHPFVILYAIIKTSIVHFDRYINGIIGLFGWQDTRMPIFSVYLYAFLLFFVSLFNTKQEKIIVLNSVKKIILFSIFISSYTFIFLACFVVNQIDMYGNIVGIMGRYFIAVFPILLLILNNKKYWINEKLFFTIITALSNLVLFIAAISIFYRFYI